MLVVMVLLLQIYECTKAFANAVLHGLVHRIPSFLPGGPGSIPGVGKFSDIYF